MMTAERIVNVLESIDAAITIGSPRDRLSSFNALLLECFPDIGFPANFESTHDSCYCFQFLDLTQAQPKPKATYRIKREYQQQFMNNGWTVRVITEGAFEQVLPLHENCTSLYCAAVRLMLVHYYLESRVGKLLTTDQLLERLV